MLALCGRAGVAIPLTQMLCHVLPFHRLGAHQSTHQRLDSGNTAWADLCQACPDLSVDSTNCSGTPVVGKLMNQRIGALARTSGIGGVFPWMLNYDSTGTNGGCVDNSLYEWLRKGIAGG